MNCYKCGSEEELSIKARFRDGRVRLMMCRGCRRKDYTEWDRPKEFDLTDWSIKAYTRVEELTRKYA